MNKVSSYASLVGVPVALLGLITYVLVSVSLRVPGESAVLAGYALTMIALVFRIYLTYRELFTIHATCSWCVSSAVVLTLLAILGTIRTLRLIGVGAAAATASG